MKHLTRIMALVVLMACAITAVAQPPSTLWTRTYGYIATEYGYCAQQTTDGGFIMAGYSSSFGAPDFYLVKTDANGDTLWTRMYGGPAPDVAFQVFQCSDGGYAAFGYTFSYGAGAMDFYLLRTNASGAPLWTHTYGGTNVDMGQDAIQTTDGGFILVGGTGSFGAGSDDYYIVKTDASGNPTWTRTYGGAGYDHAQSVVQTTDGGYMVAGYSASFGAGAHDVWLVKLNSAGDSLWTKTFGGVWSDYAYDVEQTTDGGYIVAGATASLGTGTMDIWIIKTNANGDSLWSRTFGGSGVNDYGECVKQTTDGGYIVVGYTDSFGAGYIDLYLIRLDASGNTLWTQTYGGALQDQGYSVQQTSDGGYIVAGETMSFGAGNMDYWLIRLAPEAPITMDLTPLNPPIQIPAGGGSFHFDAEITNHSSSLYSLDVEFDITLPGGENYPVFLRRGFNLGAGASLERPGLTQFVPAGAPAGNYTYNGYVYNHTTWEIMAEDHFGFVKQPGVAAAAHNLGWTLFGWDNEFSGQTAIPAELGMIAAHPNPFNAETSLLYTISEASKVRLNVYNLAGCLVATLIEGWQETGTHQVMFNGSHLPSGIYLAKIEAGSFSAIQKIVLLK